MTTPRKHFAHRILSRCDSHWFFRNPPWPLRLICVYIWGDALVIIPFVIFLCLVAIRDGTFAALLALIFFIVRNLIEVVYWLLQQFGDRSYRPVDFGLKNLDNHALYILYQLSAFVQATLGIGILVYFFYVQTN